MQEQAAAFERGARALNPDVTVSEAWVESWDDEEQARALVRKTSQQGADVLLINLDVDSTAAHDEAAQMGVSVIAWVYDQPEVTSDAVIATVIQGVPVIMLEGAKLVQQDRWEGRLYKFGLHEEAQYLTPAPGDFTSEEQQRLDDMAYAILTGKIDVSPARE
jgi:basic membrane lipoprotein Med (substrate-binding protein (PBP1-ABC) superfamily)